MQVVIISTLIILLSAAIVYIVRLRERNKCKDRVISLYGRIIELPLLEREDFAENLDYVTEHTDYDNKSWCMIRMICGRIKKSFPHPYRSHILIANLKDNSSLRNYYFHQLQQYTEDYLLENGLERSTRIAELAEAYIDAERKGYYHFISIVKNTFSHFSPELKATIGKPFEHELYKRRNGRQRDMVTMK